MAYQKGGFLVFLIHVWFHYSQSSYLSVPILTWSNSDTTKLLAPSITAGQTKDLSDVYKKYLEPLIKSKSVVLLFLQDELSADDFKKYASSFPHLQNVFKTKEYLLLPSVSRDKESINKLISASGEIEYVDSSSLNDWKYNTSSEKTAKRIIVFHLEPVSGSSYDGKGKILRSNDVLMYRIIKSLIKEGVADFGVIYSAEDPSPLIANILVEENVNDLGITSRHILQASGNRTQRFFNNSCVMLYVESIRHTYHEETTEFIKSYKKDWKVGGCGSHGLGCSISLTREGPIGKYANITLLMAFKNDTQSHQWYCDLLRLSGTHGGESFSYSFDCGGSNESAGSNSAVYNAISAPKGMSFACNELTPYCSDNGTGPLVLSGIQVQTSCDKSIIKSFSSAFHCVGFFTIEILTAIFVTIILMIGLYVGCMMMMAIQVQDRFDDPKGKTISVATSGE